MCEFYLTRCARVENACISDYKMRNEHHFNKFLNSPFLFLQQQCIACCNNRCSKFANVQRLKHWHTVKLRRRNVKLSDASCVDCGHVLNTSDTSVLISRLAFFILYKYCGTTVKLCCVPNIRNHAMKVEDSRSILFTPLLFIIA